MNTSVRALTKPTLATLMLNGGELPGWVQKMMGHESLKMILERYYSYIKNYAGAVLGAIESKAFLPQPSWMCADCAYQDACRSL